MDLSVNLAMAKEFLRSFDEDLRITFQLFDDKKKSKRADHFTANFDDSSWQERLTRANLDGYGVFFMSNEGDGLGRSGENVTKLRALVVDLDGAPLQPVLECPIEPHFIIESSHRRYQCHWLIDPVPLTAFDTLDLAKEFFASLQAGVAHKFGGDPKVKDLARVFRVPGFLHQKGDPFQSRVIQHNQGLPYPLEKLIEGLALNLPESKPVKEKLPPLAEIQEIKKGERHDMLMRLAAKEAHLGGHYDDVRCKIEGINRLRCVPPIEDVNELDQIARDAIRYAERERLKVVEIDFREFKHEHAPLQTYLPDRLADEAPGLVGQITRAIIDSAHYPQPALSLAAAISFVGFLKGHRLRLDGPDTRSNVLTVGVAPTGSGKEHPRKYVEKILSKLGLEDKIIARPVSDAGLRNGLARRGGLAFSPIDEIGHYFGALTNGKSGMHLRQIFPLLLEFYSRSDGDYYMNEYAYEMKEVPWTVIHCPHLCVLGFSTPETFFPALSSSHLSDGQLGRWLLFHPEILRPKRKRLVSSPQPSNEILEYCRQLYELPTNQASTSNLERICPTNVEVTEEAQRLFDEKTDLWEDKIEILMSKGDPSYALWTRAYEHLRKISLIVEDVGNPIQAATVEFSAAVVTACIESMQNGIRSNLSDSPFESDLKAIYEFIKNEGAKGKDVTQSAITRKFQRLEPKRRIDAISTLKEAGRILEIFQPTKTPGRTATAYRCVVN